MKLRQIVALAAATVLAASLAACGSSDGGTAKSGNAKKLSIGLAQGAVSWDPANLTLGKADFLGSCVFDTLLELEADGTLAPRAAESFEYNDDNTVLTMKLRSGMKFTSGNPVNAEAVKATMDHDKAGGGTTATFFVSVEEVKVVDDLTFTITLKQPDPGFLQNLAGSAGLIADPASFDKPDLSTNPVGSGAYTLNVSKTRPGTKYTFDRNPDYWNKKAYHYDQVEVTIIADATAMLNALKQGQIQFGEITPALAGSAKDAGLTVKKQAKTVGSIYFADMSGKSIPALADVRVRQAINYAVDKKSIVSKIFYDFGTPSSEIFPDFLPAADKSRVYDYDVAKAKALMADAGFADGFKVTMPGYPQIAPMQPSIAQQLGAIGIKVTWQNVPQAQVFTLLSQGKFPMFISYPGTEGTPHDLAINVAQGGLLNPYDRNTPELTTMLNAAQGEPDDAKRNDEYKEIGQYLFDNAWFAPIMVAETAFGVNKDTVYTVKQANIHVTPLNFKPAG